MFTFVPYLYFSGNAKEAIAFYTDALNGKVIFSQSYKDAPFETSAELDKHIMHATLRFPGGQTLMISDSMDGKSMKEGTNTAISINLDDLNLADNIFANLAKGATIHMPFENQFWGSRFGQLKDKFGISWMVNCNLGQTS